MIEREEVGQCGPDTLEGYPFTVSTNCDDNPVSMSYYEKEDPDKQSKADMRRESQVLNPSLPRRFKKGSKR